MEDVLGGKGNTPRLRRIRPYGKQHMYSGGGITLAELRPEMVETMRVLALYAPLFSMTPLCSGFLQAMKYPSFSVIIAIVRNLILIGLFMIASAYTLMTIMWALVFGHLIGAVIISVVTYFTFRYVRRNVFPAEPQMG